MPTLTMFSPAGVVPQPAALTRAVRRLRALGFDVHVDADARARQYLARQMENHFFGDGADAAQGYVPPTA